METTMLNHKLRPQPALAHLSESEREQIADWLRTQTYAQVLERVAKQRSEGGFDLHISIRVLQTLRERTAHQQLINDQLEDKLQLAELLALENGEPVKWSQGTYQLVQRAAFKLALLPDQTPARLASLLRLADHPRVVANDEHKKQIAERNTAVREGQLSLARSKSSTGRGAFHPRPTSIPLGVDSALPAPPENAQFLTPGSELMSRPSDHLGPLARNWEDVRERARRAFNISPEESARRAELRRTWKQPLIDPVPPENTSSGQDGGTRLNIVDLLKELGADPALASPAEARRINSETSPAK